MKACTYILMFLLFINVISCIETKTPDPEKTNGTGSEIIQGDGTKKKIMMYGYGYMKGESKTAVERFAIHRAKASIAEQIKGSAFTITMKNNEITFTSDTGDVAVSGISTVAKEQWQNNKEWEMYVIQKAEVEIFIPRDTTGIVKNVSGEDADISFLISFLKGRAISEVIQEKGLQTKEKVTGHIYLSSLEVELLSQKKRFGATTRFIIILD